MQKLGGFTQKLGFMTTLKKKKDLTVRALGSPLLMAVITACFEWMTMLSSVNYSPQHA